MVIFKTYPTREFTDYLLKGWAEIQWVPDQPVHDLETACNLNPASYMAHLLYAQALRVSAEGLTDPQVSLATVNHALEELQAVNRFLPDNPRVLGELVLANLVASDRHRELGDSKRSQECLDSIQDCMGRLASSPESTDAQYARLMYFHRTGQDDEALADFTRAVQAGPRVGDSYTVLCASIYYRRHMRAEALAAYDRTDARFKELSAFARAYIELEDLRDAETRAAFARKYSQEFERRLAQTSGLYGIFDWTVLRLVDSPPDASRNVARIWHESCRIVPEPDQWMKMAEYMQGLCSAEELLRDCQNRRAYVAHANFVIAVDSLGNRDRESATRHFTQVLQTDHFRTYAYWWSQAFLERLHDDPNWLPWLKD